MSRPRSGGRTSTPTARPAAQRGVYVQSPKSDIYVALLGVALGAMVLGCLLLLLVWQRYEFKVKAAALDRPRAAAVAGLTPIANFEILSTERL